MFTSTELLLNKGVGVVSFEGSTVINQSSLVLISPVKPGSVAGQPNQCSTAKSKQFRNINRAINVPSGVLMSMGERPIHIANFKADMLTCLKQVSWDILTAAINIKCHVFWSPSGRICHHRSKRFQWVAVASVSGSTQLWGLHVAWYHSKVAVGATVDGPQSMKSSVT